MFAEFTTNSNSNNSNNCFSDTTCSSANSHFFSSAPKGMIVKTSQTHYNSNADASDFLQQQQQQHLPFTVGSSSVNGHFSVTTSCSGFESTTTAASEDFLFATGQQQLQDTSIIDQDLDALLSFNNVNNKNSSMVNMDIQFQPTPINEDADLRVVRELPLLSESLLVDRQTLCQMLRPLQQSDEAAEHAAASVTDDDSSMSGSRTGSETGVVNHQLRTDQYEQWKDRYNELLAYKLEHGDCNVPYHHPENPRLSQWVKRQRHQRKLKLQGKYSNLSDDRQDLLNQVGFIWDSRSSNWEQRFEDLRTFQEEHGHVKVSARDPRYRSLATWLKRQRQNARKLHAGDESTGMTRKHLAMLLGLGVKLNVHLAKVS